MTTSHNNAQRQQQEPASDEQYITTFFCRALYDYQTQDNSSLSFQRDDVIEVLTRLESGWWDGLLGDERGWFPSNYVAVISDEEAEAALTGSEYSGQQIRQTESMAESNSTITQSQSADWLNEDLGSDSRNELIELANAALDQGSTPANDFWMPEVTPEGMVSNLLIASLPLHRQLNAMDRFSTRTRRPAKFLATYLWKPMLMSLTATWLG